MLFLDDLLIDEVNEAKMAAHEVGVMEALEVLDVARYELFQNPARRRGGAPYVIVGPTRAGRLLTMPIDDTPVDGLWRPRTAYDSGKQQAVAYHGRRRGKRGTL